MYLYSKIWKDKEELFQESFCLCCLIFHITPSGGGYPLFSFGYWLSLYKKIGITGRGDTELHGPFDCLCDNIKAGQMEKQRLVDIYAHYGSCK